jgi:hypothetical protein
MSTQVKNLKDVRQLLDDLRKRIRASFVGDIDGLRCDEAIKVIDKTAGVLSEIVNSDMAMSEEDEGRKSPLLKKTRALMAE